MQNPFRENLNNQQSKSLKERYFLKKNQIIADLKISIYHIRENLLQRVY